MSIFGVGVTNFDSMMSSSRETRTASGAGAYGGVGNVYAPYQITRQGTATSPGGISHWKFVDTHNESPAARALHAGEQALGQTQSTLNEVLGVTQGATDTAKKYADSMGEQAALVNSQGASINELSDALLSLVPQYDPYRAQLSGYGDTLSRLAEEYANQQKDMFGQGKALVGMDRTAGGLAGEYMGIYDLLSPERYVSRAASDTQASFDNAEGQLARNNARRGVSAGSAAAQVLGQQLARMKAVALAAAKTSARQTGIEQQGNWLNQMTSAADTLYNMGLKQGEASMAATNAAGEMTKGAASLLSQQGATISEAAQLRATVGQLYSNAASIFGSAAGVEGDAAKLTVSAYNAIAEAQNAAADFYLKAASTPGVY